VLLLKENKGVAQSRPLAHHMHTPLVVTPVTSVLNSSIADFMCELLSGFWNYPCIAWATKT
jgi:hypothetical protein